ncbi:right-handed parallel beta-helix repeat-containing protein [Bowmanella sp. Y26]|uniref:right-handed parallel beta-helix repeat-containing protein n=1 Tax=Bowmanella yangjiangensis TaxID=2811230 RepID=UPI001BDCE8F5|nr:right-handed parallel beta-helix repeat-containing protein [Bowmanella yangjiangensis]MBT1062575.1 right-handed parallel beta-helix repeat-containing protein [Bowmanella yangjiangensis]
MQPRLARLFLLLCLLAGSLHASVKAQDINVQDFGAVPGKPDVSQAVQAAIAQLHRQGGGTLRFPAGEYHFKLPGAQADFARLMRGELHYDTKWGKPGIAYHKAMSFVGLSKVEIIGEDARLVFHGLVQPMEFVDSQQVRVQGLSIDWQRPAFSVGTVVASRADGFDLQVDNDFPLQGGEPVWALMDFDVQRNRLGLVDDWRLSAPLQLLAPQLVRISGSKAVPVGNRVILRHVGNYRPAIHLLRTSQVRFEDVQILAAPGMGIIGHQCADIVMQNLQVKPKGGRLMSTNTDATHFISCTGEIRIQDSYFEGMGDDATNVHGFYLSIQKSVSTHSVRAYLSVNTQDLLPDWPQPGDEMEWVRGDTLKPYARNTLTGIELNDDGSADLHFAQPIDSAVLPTDLLANASKVARLVFKNNQVKRIRARGILFQSRGALIENNEFVDNTGTGILIDTATGWMESIGTRDVVIRNNTLVGNGYGDGTYMDASGIAVLTESSAMAPGVHNGLLIENNRIQGVGKTGVYICCSRDVTLKDNQIAGNEVSLRLEYSDKVQLDGHFPGWIKGRGNQHIQLSEPVSATPR